MLLSYVSEAYDGLPSNHFEVVCRCLAVLVEFQIHQILLRLSVSEEKSVALKRVTVAVALSFS